MEIFAKVCYTELKSVIGVVCMDVKSIISQMTLEEKTCQMATLYGSGRGLKDAWPTAGWSAEIWKDGIGNIDEQAFTFCSMAMAGGIPLIKSHSGLLILPRN